MLQRLKERTDLNIYEFVTNMRSRRMFMVQNLVGLNSKKHEKSNTPFFLHTMPTYSVKKGEHLERALGEDIHIQESFLLRPSSMTLGIFIFII